MSDLSSGKKNCSETIAASRKDKAIPQNKRKARIKCHIDVALAFISDTD